MAAAPLRFAHERLPVNADRLLGSILEWDDPRALSQMEAVIVQVHNDLLTAEAGPFIGERILNANSAAARQSGGDSELVEETSDAEVSTATAASQGGDEADRSMLAQSMLAQSSVLDDDDVDAGMYDYGTPSPVGDFPRFDEYYGDASTEPFPPDDHTFF